MNQLSFLPDRLSEAMVATAGGYFLNGEVLGTEAAEDFRQTFHNFYDYHDRLSMGRMVLAAGLLAAGFTIKAEPLQIDTPELEPEEAIDKRLFVENWYAVAPTIIDMGLRATSKESPAYDDKITDFVINRIPYLN